MITAVEGSVFPEVRTMVIVTGRPPDILTATTRALCEQGVTARVVMCPESAGPDALFDLAWAERPTHVIAVDALSSLTEEQPTAAPDDPLLTEALRAARSAANPVLIWVTAQQCDDDDTLRKIRRSGVAYVIVRAGRVIRSGDLNPMPVPGRDIWVPPDLPMASEGLCTTPSVAAALVSIVCDDDSVGRTITVSWSGEDAWRSAIASLGSRPRAVTRRGARWSRWFGRPVLRVSRQSTEPTILREERVSRETSRMRAARVSAMTT